MKPIWTIIITVVATAAIVGGGTWYLIDSNAKKDKQTLQTELDTLNQKIAEESATSGTVVTSGATATTGATVTDETASWKTFSSAKYGFSAKYPENWLINDYVSESKRLYILSPDRKAKLDAGRIVRLYDVSVNIYTTASELPNNQTKKLSFENWIKEEADNYGFTSRKATTFDGGIGYVGKGTGEITTYLMFVVKNGIIYQIETGESETPSSTEQSIIDSIKLITPDVTADWKTYTNKDLGISFKYPNTWKDIKFSKIDQTNDANKANTGINYNVGWGGGEKNYVDPENAFNFNLYSKDFVSVPVFAAYSKSIDPTWTMAQYNENHVISANTALAYKSINGKAVLAVNYFNMECSPGLGMTLIVPTKNLNHPNLFVHITFDLTKDASVKAFEAKQVASQGDACDMKDGYQPIADKIMAGTYSAAIDAQKKILEGIANSYNNI